MLSLFKNKISSHRIREHGIIKLNNEGIVIYMKKKIEVTKLVTVAILMSLMLSFVACGTKYEAVKPDKDPLKVVEDKNYTEDLNKEKGIQTGQVYIQNETVIGTMVFKEDVSDEQAKKLAEKYASEIKKTYIDMKINVQAVKNGRNIANITLEK